MKKLVIILAASISFSFNTFANLEPDRCFERIYSDSETVELRLSDGTEQRAYEKFEVKSVRYNHYNHRNISTEVQFILKLADGNEYWSTFYPGHNAELLGKRGSDSGDTFFIVSESKRNGFDLRLESHYIDFKLPNSHGPYGKYMVLKDDVFNLTEIDCE